MIKRYLARLCESYTTRYAGVNTKATSPDCGHHAGYLIGMNLR